MIDLDTSDNDQAIIHSIKVQNQNEGENNG